MTNDRAKWLSDAGFGIAVHWTSFTLPENPTDLDFKKPNEKRIADYQAGEENWLHRSPNGRFSGEGGTQWFGFSWMDDFWVHDKPGVPTPRFSDDEVLAYVKRVKQNGGAFAYNTAIYREGRISAPTMAQLKWISERL